VDPAFHPQRQLPRRAQKVLKQASSTFVKRSVGEVPVGKYNPNMPKPVPRQRKHKARAREAAASQDDGGADANVAEIIPASKAEKEDRRRKMKDELRAKTSKSSSKKNKRLDKYIVCMSIALRS